MVQRKGIQHRDDNVARKHRTILVDPVSWSMAEGKAPASMSALVEDLVDVFVKTCDKHPEAHPKDVLAFIRKRSTEKRIKRLHEH